MICKENKTDPDLISPAFLNIYGGTQQIFLDLLHIWSLQNILFDVKFLLYNAGKHYAQSFVGTLNKFSLTTTPSQNVSDLFI